MHRLSGTVLIVRSKSANRSLLYTLCEAYFQRGNAANAEITAESVAAYSKEASGESEGVGGAAEEEWEG